MQNLQINISGIHSRSMMLYEELRKGKYSIKGHLNVSPILIFNEVQL